MKKIKKSGDSCPSYISSRQKVKHGKGRENTFINIVIKHDFICIVSLENKKKTFFMIERFRVKELIEKVMQASRNLFQKFQKKYPIYILFSIYVFI